MNTIDNNFSNMGTSSNNFNALNDSVSKTTKHNTSKNVRDLTGYVGVISEDNNEEFTNTRVSTLNNLRYNTHKVDNIDKVDTTYQMVENSKVNQDKKLNSVKLKTYNTKNNPVRHTTTNNTNIFLKSNNLLN